MGFSKNKGCFPQNGWWKSWNTLIQMDDLGVKHPLFSETSRSTLAQWPSKICGPHQNTRWPTTKGAIWSMIYIAQIRRVGFFCFPGDGATWHVKMQIQRSSNTLGFISYETRAKSRLWTQYLPYLPNPTILISVHRISLYNSNFPVPPPKKDTNLYRIILLDINHLQKRKI